jgi:hypothetical protein
VIINVIIIMPVSGFGSTVVVPGPPSVNSMASNSTCSSPSPTNSLPHAQQNGQLMDVDCPPSKAVSSHSLNPNIDRDLSIMDDFSNHLSISPKPIVGDREKFEMTTSLAMFDGWSFGRQTEFVEHLITRMSFHQHEHLYSILIPMLQRDFITALPSKQPIYTC